MKKIHICRWFALLLAAAVICTASGCTKENAADIEGTKNYRAPDADTVATLTILTSSRERVGVEMARADFTRSYPNVKIEIQSYNENADAAELSELHEKQLAGEGADIVLMDEDGYARVCDFNKASQEGAFVDLAKYFDRDPNWSWNGYSKAVVDGMRQGDKQYLLPLYYHLPVLVTTTTLLSQSGVRISECDTGIGLLNELARCEEQAENGYHMLDSGAWQNFSDLFAVNPVTFRSGKGKLNWTGDFDEILLAYDNAGQALGWFQNADVPEGDNCYERLIGGKTYFVLSTDSKQTFTDIASLALKGLYPQIIPIYTADGSGITARATEVAAISSGSKNPKLAYEFLKCLLSKDAQYMFRYSYLYGDGTATIAECMPICHGAARCVLVNNSFSDETVTDAYGREIVLNASTYLNKYLDLADQVVYTYMESGCDVDVSDCFAPYFRRNKSLEYCYEEASDQLEMYVSE